MTVLAFAVAFTLAVSFFCSLLDAMFLSTTTAEVEALKERNTSARRRSRRTLSPPKAGENQPTKKHETPSMPAIDTPTAKPSRARSAPAPPPPSKIQKLSTVKDTAATNDLPLGCACEVAEGVHKGASGTVLSTTAHYAIIRTSSGKDLKCGRQNVQPSIARPSLKRRRSPRPNDSDSDASRKHVQTKAPAHSKTERSEFRERSRSRARMHTHHERADSRSRSRSRSSSSSSTSSQSRSRSRSRSPRRHSRHVYHRHHEHHERERRHSSRSRHRDHHRRHRDH